MEYRGLVLPDEFMRRKIIKNDEFYLLLSVTCKSVFCSPVITEGIEIGLVKVWQRHCFVESLETTLEIMVLTRIFFF